MSPGCALILHLTGLSCNQLPLKSINSILPILLEYTTMPSSLHDSVSIFHLEDANKHKRRHSIICGWLQAPRDFASRWFKGYHERTKILRINQVEETWQHIKNSMSSAASSVSSGANMHPNDHRISSRSIALIETRKTVPASNEFDSTRRYLRR